jgi:hypothetical protein
MNPINDLAATRITRGALQMSEIASERDVVGVPVEVPGVMGKLEATRQEFARYQFWLRLARALLAAILVSSVLVFADWMWVLPTIVRGLGLVAMFGVGIFELVRSRLPIDRAATASNVENHFPELGQRLRTVVEYAEPAPDTAPASPGLIKALGRDTESRTGELEFRKLVPWASFERRAVGVFLASAIGIVCLLASPGLRTAALRMLLRPVHYTTLNVEPGNVTMNAGEEFSLKIALYGRPVESAFWSYQKDGRGRWTTLSLAGDRGQGAAGKRLSGALGASLKDCQTDFDYRVVAGELESPTFHVRVVHPLILKGIEATVTPPSYTNRRAEVVKEGNFTAIEGSRVKIAVLLDRAPRTASLLLGPQGDSSRQSIPLQIDGARLTGELPPIANDVRYEIAAADDEGMSLGAESYRVKVQADEKPTIRFISPAESLAVTPTTEIPIEVEAGDDFGVARLGINYKVGDGPEETLHLASFENLPVTAAGLATLYLEKHTLSFTDAITYYAFVEDNFPASPHRVVSELRYIDILPYKQAYKFVDGQGSGNSSLSLSLEELIARQRVNLNRTFLLERDRSIGEGAVMRLATFEEELASATAEFSEGLKANGGAVAALDEAASEMRTATISLDAKELTAARPHEERALKWLISARRNLLKLLTQGNSSQASACRQFDRQQAQRIRRPRKDESKLEEDLRELAQREDAFSEEIEALGGGGAEVDPLQPKVEQPMSSEEPPPEASKTEANPDSSTNSRERARNRPDPVQEQKQAAKDAERLRQLARQDRALTELANRRLEAASQAVQESSRLIEAGQKAQAAEQARSAARQLEAAARQVGALKAKELTERLARQRDFAQAIAKAERELGTALERASESKAAGAQDRQQLADKQNALADDVVSLADVLKELKLAAAEEQPELAQSIVQATKANPPEEVEESMRKNTATIGAGQHEPAARTAARVANRLDALAQDLESIRRAAIQPQLDRLLAAEKQAAELQDRFGLVKQPSQQAEAEKSLAEIARLLDNLAPAEGSLREATDRLIAATQSSHAGWTWNDMGLPGKSGYFVPPVVYTGNLGAAIVALQAKIQEIVLDNALVERIGPVPPQYKNLVDDYYRVLSQDLR